MSKSDLELFEEALKKGNFAEAGTHLRDAQKGDERLTKENAKKSFSKPTFSSDNIMDRVLEAYQKQREDVALKTKTWEHAAGKYRKLVTATGDTVVDPKKEKRRSMAQSATYNALSDATAAQENVESILKSLTKLGIHFNEPKHHEAYGAFVDGNQVFKAKIEAAAVASFKVAEEGMKSNLDSKSTSSTVDDKEFKESLKASLKAYRAGVLPPAERKQLEEMFKASGVDSALKSIAPTKNPFKMFLRVVSKKGPKFFRSSRSDKAIDAVISESKKNNFNTLQTDLEGIDKKVTTATNDKTASEALLKAAEQERVKLVAKINKGKKDLKAIKNNTLSPSPSTPSATPTLNGAVGKSEALGAKAQVRIGKIDVKYNKEVNIALSEEGTAKDRAALKALEGEISKFKNDIKGTEAILKGHMQGKEAVVKKMETSLAMQKEVLTGDSKTKADSNQALYNTAKKECDEYLADHMNKFTSRISRGKEEVDRITSVGKEVKAEAAAALKSTMSPEAALQAQEIKKIMAVLLNDDSPAPTAAKAQVGTQVATPKRGASSGMGY